MGVALLLSYVFAICQSYGKSMSLRTIFAYFLLSYPTAMTVGLGDHQVNVSEADLMNFRKSLFAFQRCQQFALLCVKTSILLFYVRLFPTQTFKKIAWCVWLFTVAWCIEAFLTSLLQCIPVAFAYDKSIPGGKCLSNGLISIGVSNGVLSCIGDVMILCLPIPMIWGLQVDRRRRIALVGIFLVGILYGSPSFQRETDQVNLCFSVTATSIIRIVALFEIDTSDITCKHYAPLSVRCVNYVARRCNQCRTLIRDLQFRMLSLGCGPTWRWL
jgi:hypothetical protein